MHQIIELTAQSPSVAGARAQRYDAVKFHSRGQQ
jgi:hypothetical protein